MINVLWLVGGIVSSQIGSVQNLIPLTMLAIALRLIEAVLEDCKTDKPWWEREVR